MGVHTLECMI